MSRIEELLQELCPNGVEYIRIGDVVNYEQPTKYIVESTKYDESFNIPVLTAGQTFILGYTNETENIYKSDKEKPVIIFDDFTGSFKWVDFPFKVKSSAMKILKADENRTIIRYIFHVMGYLNYSSSEHKRLWIGIYSNFQIPLPPLEVQREIVKILDSYSANVTALQQELDAELTARKKQYEYYRDKLLTFNNIIKVKLGNICEIGDGLHGTPDYDPNGVYYFINGNNLSNGKIIVNEKTKKVSEREFEKYDVNLNRAIIMSINGTIGNVAIYSNENVVLGKSAAYFNIISPDLSTKFLYYYLQTQFSKDYFEKNLTGSTIKNLGLKALRKYEIPFPPLEKQFRIVSILDRFDKLCNDISEGLTAEIEARQKQYEYYRDRLLSFEYRSNQ